MIDHIGIKVHDHAASKRFYLSALAPLDIGVVMSVTRAESGASSDGTIIRTITVRSSST
jgi:hypothetical protein